MAEILKKNWFVVLIAVLLCGFAIYYVWDTTKDFVKGKSVDGKDVIASIDNYDLTADDLYGEIERFSVSQLYYRFRNAVIEQTVTEETDEMKENADKLKENLEAQAQSSSSYSADELISNMLESVGLESNELDRFCMLAQKESVMQRNYVEKNYDTLMKDVKNAHIISLIEISVSDADALSDDESETKEKIDAALKKGTAFADVAADYTQSTQTDENGLYGYVDSETEASSTLTDDMLKAALALKEGESSWIKVSGDSGDKLVLIYADVVGKDNIKASKDSDVWSSLVSALISRNSTLSSEILFDAADQLEITFTDDTMLSRLRTYAGLDQ